MYCSECGNEIPNNSKFCPTCGLEQETTDNREGNSKAVQTKSKPIQPVLNEEEQKKRNKKIRLVALGGVALIVIICMLTFFVKPSIDLNRYILVEFNGYDTVGKATATFDYEKFSKDYGKKLDQSENIEFSFFGKKDSYNSNYAAEDFIEECVNWSLSSDKSLANNDEITLIWECRDEYALEQYGYRLKYKEKVYTVSGLSSATTFDPFEGYEVTFEGISPNGEAYMTGEPVHQEANSLHFNFDKNYDLSNGDSITVSVSSYGDDLIEYCIEQFGKIPSPTEKNFTVSGLDSYVQSMSEISEENLTQMKEQARDVYTAYVARDWGDGEKLENLTYLGNYLLTAKDNGNSRKNYLYLVYKAEVKNYYTSENGTYDKTNEVYWYIVYRNLLVDTEGTTTVDVTAYSTPNNRYTIDSGISSGWYGTKTWYYSGFGSLTDLYKAVVESNMEYYNHEDDVAEDSSEGGEAVTIEAPEPETENGMIFANSSEVLLSEDAISALSDENLRYAINEIYARHGYIFKDEGLREYYGQFEWYEGTIEADDFSSDMFNDVEMKNVELLQVERDSRS